MVTKRLIVVMLMSGLSMMAADAPGTGQFSLTGERNISSAFRINGCSIDKPGKGLIAGYTMDTGEDNPMLSEIMLQVPSYTQDGVFRSGPADANQKPRPVRFSALARLQRNDPFASPIQQGNEATLTATIRDHGNSGTLEMHNVTWLLDRPYKVSGTMTWTCSSVKIY